VELEKFVHMALQGGWGCIGVFFAHEFQRMRRSVEALNLNVARVVEQISGHEQDIKELKRRLERVERV
jgi:hypothetical protein